MPTIPFAAGAAAKPPRLTTVLLRSDSATDVPTFSTEFRPGEEASIRHRVERLLQGGMTRTRLHISAHVERCRARHPTSRHARDHGALQEICSRATTWRGSSVAVSGARRRISPCFSPRIALRISRRGTGLGATQARVAEGQDASSRTREVTPKACSLARRRGLLLRAARVRGRTRCRKTQPALRGLVRDAADHVPIFTSLGAALAALSGPTLCPRRHRRELASAKQARSTRLVREARRGRCALDVRLAPSRRCGELSRRSRSHRAAEITGRSLRRQRGIGYF